jgi:hypothetical protein
MLGVLLSGSFDASATLGGAAPFGDLEFNNAGGISGSIGIGYDHGPSHWELANELQRLPGNQQADYALDIYRVSVSYHYALVNKIDWQLRVGGGLDWNSLTRRLGAVTESGSILGGTLALSYVRSFGHPKFLFQLYGSELIDPGQTGVARTVQDATLIGVRLGVGYEL